MSPTTGAADPQLSKRQSLAMRRPNTGTWAEEPDEPAPRAPEPQPALESAPQDPNPSVCIPQHRAPPHSPQLWKLSVFPAPPPHFLIVPWKLGSPLPGSPRVVVAAASGPRPPRAPRRPRLCLRRLRSHRGQSPRRPASAQRPLLASYGGRGGGKGPREGRREGWTWMGELGGVKGQRKGM